MPGALSPDGGVDTGVIRRLPNGGFVTLRRRTRASLADPRTDCEGSPGERLGTEPSPRDEGDQREVRRVNSG
jgi:hypothetical protein